MVMVHSPKGDDGNDEIMAKECIEWVLEISSMICLHAKLILDFSLMKLSDLQRSLHWKGTTCIAYTLSTEIHYL